MCVLETFVHNCDGAHVEALPTLELLSLGFLIGNGGEGGLFWF